MKKDGKTFNPAKLDKRLNEAHLKDLSAVPYPLETSHSDCAALHFGGTEVYRLLSKGYRDSAKGNKAIDNMIAKFLTHSDETKCRRSFVVKCKDKTVLRVN